jgi:hypothetical protein
MTAAAIDTLTLAWSAIRDEFRARLRGIHVAPWWEHARLLRVMGFGHGFGWNIQQTYNQRRGSNLLLSPLDWLQVEWFATYDFPLRGIERGIHAMFDRRDRAPVPWQINSLTYCDQAIIEESELMKEASVGSGIDFHFPNWPQKRPRPHTLLLAVPPAGRMTFAAMQSERQVDRVAELFQVGIVFTVYPDAWHKEQARTRFGMELEFLDPEINLHHGDTEARSEQVSKLSDREKNREDTGSGAAVSQTRGKAGSRGRVVKDEGMAEGCRASGSLPLPQLDSSAPPCLRGENSQEAS